MPLVPDQKFSTFFNGGDLQVDDIVVGLRNGINTKFTYTGELPVGLVVPVVNGGTGLSSTPANGQIDIGNGSGFTRATLTAGSGVSITNGAGSIIIAVSGSGAVTSLTGTANQVLVNGTSGSAQTGALTLTTPQNIATNSSPTFAALTLTSPLTVPNGGSGRNTGTAYALVASGTTATGIQQSLSTGTSGQLLQSGGAGALPSWTTATFPSGSGTLNHLLRSDGTNWVQTTATTLDASDVLSGLTQLNVDNLRLDGNTFSSTNSNGNINIVPNGTGVVNCSSLGTSGLDASFLGSDLVVASNSSPVATIASFINSSGGAGSLFFAKSRGTTPGSYVTVQSGDDLGLINWFGDDGTSYANAGFMQMKVSGAVSTGIVPTQLLIGTSNTSGSNVTAITISNAQVVTLANALPVASGGSGRTSATAFTLIAGGTTSTAAHQSLTAGTSGQLLQSSGSAAIPTWTTATFPAAAGSTGTILRSNGTGWVASTATFADTYTASNLLYSNGSNTVTGLATANSGMLVTSGAGVPSISALSAGQIFIGTTGAAPTAAAINSGTGILVANGSGTITVSATGGGFNFATISGTSQSAAVNTRYLALNSGQTTVTLPTTYAVNDIIILTGAAANTGGWVVTAAAGDTVFVINTATSAGGTVTSPAVAGQSITLMCDVANTSWVMTSAVVSGVFTTT